MNTFVETLIYLFAIMGIILTTMSFFDMFNYKDLANNSYKLFGKNSMKPKRVDIVITIQGYNEEESEQLVDKILDGNYDRIEDIVSTVDVIKKKAKN